MTLKMCGEASCLRSSHDALQQGKLQGSKLHMIWQHTYRKIIGLAELAELQFAEHTVCVHAH